MIIWGDHDDDRDGKPTLFVLMFLCVSAVCIILAQLHVFGRLIDTIGGWIR